MEHDQESTGVENEIFRFENSKIVFEKYSKYHCALFEDGAFNDSKLL